MSEIGNAPLKLIDARQSWASPKVVPLLDGPANVISTPFPANSNAVGNQTYIVNVPSKQTGLNRNIQYHWKGTAQINGTAPSTNLLSAGVIVGLSDSCADQIIQNETVIIAGQSNNVLRSTTCLELNRIDSPSSLSAGYETGSGGNLKDNYANFVAWSNTNRNVLALPYDVASSDQIASPRTCDIQITGATTTSMTVQFEIYFCSKVSPFLQSNHQVPCIWGNTSVTFTLAFESQLSRFFSFLVPTGYAVTSVTNFQFQTCEILAEFITPSQTALMYQSPQENFFNYYKIQTYPSTAVTVPFATGPNNRSRFQLALQQCNDSVIPDLFIIACRPVQNQLPLGGALAPRVYFPPVDGGMNLQFNNKSVLNTMTKRKLYEMSVRNGLSQTTYEQWNQNDLTYIQGASDAETNLVMGGSFVLVNPARDFQLCDNGISNGVRSNWSLSGSITFECGIYDDANLYGNGTNLSVELVVISVIGGVWSIDVNGNSTQMNGLLTVQDALASLHNGQIPISDEANMNGTMHSYGYQGGSFFSKLKHLATRAVHHASNAYEFAKKHQGTVEEGLNIAKGLLGKGYGGAIYGGGASLNTSRKAVADKQLKALAYMNK